MTQTCTTIEQSKKLMNFGNDENTADFYWITGHIHTNGPKYQILRPAQEVSDKEHFWPAWSLSALLELLECPMLHKDKIGNGKEAWMVTCYPDGSRIDSNWTKSSIDACIDMITKLKEIGKL